MAPKTDPFIAAQTRRSEERSATRCELCSQVAATDKAFRGAFRAALLNDSISAPTIVDVLAQHDIATSDTAIRQHRRNVRIGKPCPGLARVAA